MNYEKETCDPSQGNAHPILYLGIATHNACSFLTHEQKPPFEARHGIDMKTLGFLFFFPLPSPSFLFLPRKAGLGDFSPIRQIIREDQKCNAAASQSVTAMEKMT